MRVLMVTPHFYPSVGGVETVCEILARGLTGRGIDVHLLTDQRLGDAAEITGYPVTRNATPAEKRRLVRWAGVVHIHGPGIRLWPYCVLRRKPIVWTHHGLNASCLANSGWHAGKYCDHRWWRCLWLTCCERGLGYVVRHWPRWLLRRYALRFAARNVCVSGWVAARARVPRSVVIWNPVSVGDYAAADGVRTAGRFAFVGRLIEEKGCDVLIRALALCHQRGHRYTLDVYGDGPERSRLEGLVQAERLGAAVAFHGTVRGEALRSAFRQTGVLVFPSVCEEALGMVVVEAMAAGTPLIVSRRGGAAEAAGGCALLFDNGDYSQLAEQMIRLSEDGDLYESLARRCAEQARLFDADRIVDAHVALYREVLADRSQTPEAYAAGGTGNHRAHPEPGVTATAGRC